MSTETKNFSSISVQELANLARNGASVNLIDVRTPAEFQEVHSVYARNVPLDSLKPESFLSSPGSSNGSPIYVICNSGSRSSKACEALARAGHPQVVNVEGGTRAWDAAGLPVERGRHVVSLERQVRIAAGLLVLTGVVLGYFVHPIWYGVAAFVGGGLLFSGLTDTCGMAMVLARMPWNRVKASASGR